MMKIGNPDINSLDYDDVANKRSHTTLVNRVMQQVHDRAKRGVSDLVFVVHERMLTVDALAELIPKLKNDGYVFTRLDQLL
jgi:peptidoglycan/xylan/chitin deacetylase (PgdA/CDA1 family)